MSDTTTSKLLAAAYLTDALGGNAAAATEIAKQRTRMFEITKAAADAMANTATAETGGFSVPYAGKVTAIYLFLEADVAANAMDTITVTFSKRDAAAANQTTLGTAVSTAGWTKWVRVALTLTAANLALVAGGGVTWAVTKQGAGKVLPITKFQVWVEDV